MARERKGHESWNAGAEKMTHGVAFFSLLSFDFLLLDVDFFSSTFFRVFVDVQLRRVAGMLGALTVNRAAR